MAFSYGRSAVAARHTVTIMTQPRKGLLAPLSLYVQPVEGRKLGSPGSVVDVEKKVCMVSVLRRGWLINHDACGMEGVEG